MTLPNLIFTGVSVAILLGFFGLAAHAMWTPARAARDEGPAQPHERPRASRLRLRAGRRAAQERRGLLAPDATVTFAEERRRAEIDEVLLALDQIGRASCRERVCLYV